MKRTKLADGVAHKMPADLQAALLKDDAVLALWDKVTPLGQNEFICWVEDAKQDKTRSRRITRTTEELLEGKRRPCCWIGCIHRTDKEMSKSQKWILGRKKTKK